MRRKPKWTFWESYPSQWRPTWGKGGAHNASHKSLIVNLDVTAANETAEAVNDDDDEGADAFIAKGSLATMINAMVVAWDVEPT